MSTDFAAVGIDIPPGAHGEIDVLCPRCSPGRRKSSERCLSVNTIDGTWLCHHCGWSGRLGTSGNGYGAPLRQRMPAPPPPRVFALPRPLPEDPLPAHVLRWFAEKRSIPDWVVREAGIRWANGAVLFPYLRDGRLINVKHRLLADKRFWMVANCERIFYNLDTIAGATTVCIVEGEIDVLSMRAAGGPPALSVPDGAPPETAKHYASKFAFLNRDALARLRGATTILIGTDMDPPGVRLADELAQRLGWERCQRVSWAPHKDANEVLIAGGPDAVLTALANAAPFSVPDSAGPPSARPERQLPPARGRRPIIDLTGMEAHHAR